MQSMQNRNTQKRREQVEKLLENLRQEPEAVIQADEDTATKAPAAEQIPPSPQAAPLHGTPKLRKWWIAVGIGVILAAVLVAVLFSVLMSGPHSSPHALGKALETACLEGDCEALADLIGLEGGAEAFRSVWSEAFSKSSIVISSFVNYTKTEFSAVPLYFVDSIRGENGDFAVLYLCDQQGTPSPVYAYKSEGKWLVRQSELLQLLLTKWRTEYLAK